MEGGTGDCSPQLQGVRLLLASLSLAMGVDSGAGGGVK